jgi:outer membrane protein OmpA-like peptidoglycan-associated protein
VKLFVLRGSKKHELTTIRVQDLPAFPNRRALLRLRTIIDRGGELRIRLDVEDRLYRDERVDVRRHLRRRGPAVAAAGVAVLLLAAAAYLLFVGIGPQEMPVPRTGGETGAAEEPRGAEPAEADAAEAAPAEPDAPATDAAAPADESAADAAPAPEPESTAEPPPEPETAAEPAERSVYFTPDSPVLTPQARERLTEIADRLSTYDEDTVIRIIGHTALAGTERGRYDLSLQRAENVFAFLESAGWQPQQDLTVQGVGGDEPVTRDPERQELNRRVEITATP